MPIYEYERHNCGERFEKLVRSTNGAGQVVCPGCQSEVVEGGFRRSLQWGPLEFPTTPGLPAPPALRAFAGCSRVTGVPKLEDSEPVPKAVLDAERCQPNRCDKGLCLAPSRELKAELVRVIRDLRPDILLTWDPWRPYQLHSDHRAAGQAALDAVMAAANTRYFPEHLKDE